MRKEWMWNPIDIDERLRAFAASPQAAALRAAIRAHPCPAPEAVAAFCRGEWEEPQARQFQQHLLGCPTCAQHVARLRHPPEELLLCYARGVIPTDPAGAQLRDKIVTHLRTCAACRARGERVSWEILQWTEFQQAREKIERVRALLTGLGAFALVHQQWAQQAAARQPLSWKGAPRGAEEEVSTEEVPALVFDAAGQLVMEATGEPRTVRFVVQHAEITVRRGLYVHLLTQDTTYCQRGGPVYTVQVALQYGPQRLCIPPEEIRPGDPREAPRGEATVRQKLGVAIAVRPLPTAALRLTVQPKAQGESAHGDVPNLQH